MSVRSLQLDDIPYLLQHLRPEDIEEAAMLCGRLSLEDALTLATFLESYVYVDDADNPQVVFGRYQAYDICHVWMLGTGFITNYPYALHKWAVRILDTWSTQTLACLSYIPNRVHGVWLKRLGFIPIQQQGQFMIYIKPIIKPIRA